MRGRRVERLTAADLERGPRPSNKADPLPNVLLADSRCLQPLGPTAASRRLQSSPFAKWMPIEVAFSPESRPVFCDEDSSGGGKIDARLAKERVLYPDGGSWIAVVRPCLEKVDLVITASSPPSSMWSRPQPHTLLMSLEIWPLSAAEIRAATGEDDCCGEACGASWLLHVVPQPQPPAQPSLADAEVLRRPSSAAHDGTRVPLCPGMVTIVHSGDVVAVRSLMEQPAGHAATHGYAAMRRLDHPAGIQGSRQYCGGEAAMPEPVPSEGRAGLLQKMQLQLRQERLECAREAPVSAGASGVAALPVHGILFDSRWLGSNFDPALHWHDGFPTEDQARSASAGEILTWWAEQ